ncbi:MAG: ATP-binding protein, partial [Rhodobacteraceae bacterium]|nr:ATP-binding protein [Paracoccaceae bacterium]
HEIKNPLTPIQLSAERLKRKYADRLADDTGLFAQCTDTIVRHVGDIGRMVDEFSAFARMPAPVMAPADITKLVTDAVGLHRGAFADIEYSLTVPPDPVIVRCDGRQIGQAITNILKNAIEAISAKFGPGNDGGTAAGKVEVRLKADADKVEIEVADNGIGLPQSERHKLTEPYVTTRAKGTGLGLAIVKKIVEDHRGTLALSDAPNGGAIVKLIIPVTAGRADPRPEINVQAAQ